MIKSIDDRRVETVLNAFDTLFNKRDYASAERFWSPRYLRRQLVISSFSMGGSAVTACRRRGSSQTLCEWKMECSRSTGTSSRTKPRGSNRAAVCRCSATASRPDRESLKEIRARTQL